MIFDKQTLIEQIATVTNENDGDEISKYMLAAKNEILDLALSEGVEDVEFFGASASKNAQRTLFWLTCLFVKKSVRTIENLYDYVLSAGIAMWRMHYEEYLGELINEMRIPDEIWFTDYSRR
ncbi:hypothetical protein CV102_25610 [Natronococcus pandeyae]|uniref:Uncharacterized protein n=1 Tax=Natronococcus pandeyae TaxID=2055836 RepID=A0A8J8Q158_9EURY|nr:hypothetical protein [Natronococcus pandeyae]TYL35849.1 hypothetical protein CV102_25610 [Natronococcus pandeyae]